MMIIPLMGLVPTVVKFIHVAEHMGLCLKTEQMQPPE